MRLKLNLIMTYCINQNLLTTLMEIIQNPKLKKIVESFRDWGRDCWCLPGVDNTCGKRFDWQLGDLPAGYDHKYTYSHLGYNLKPLDIQAAIGREQLKKLPQFINQRKEDFLGDLREISFWRFYKFNSNGTKNSITSKNTENLIDQIQL